MSDSGPLPRLRLFGLVLICLTFLAGCPAYSHAREAGPSCEKYPQPTGSIDTGFLFTADLRNAQRNSRRDSPAEAPSDNVLATATGSTQSSTPAQGSAPTASIQIPRPFDSILGDNFTQPSCPDFFNNYFVQNNTFQACVPFSLLLQNSEAFFKASTMASTLGPILDASCAVSFDVCNSMMISLAASIISSTVCGNDYALRNPLVVSAYNGLVSYAPMYQAACLKADPSKQAVGADFPYCYESAVNSSSQADSQVYFLPLGTELPTGSSVSCSTCMQKTMSFFAAAASNTTSPLNSDYLDAARMINAACGVDFVNANTSLLKSPSSLPKNSGSRIIPSFVGFFIVGFSAALFV